MPQLDDIQINFDNEGLWVLNIALAVIMFGVALGITPSDFRNLAKSPKAVILGVISQFILLPLVSFLFIILLKPAPSIALGLFLVAACPGGNISNFMTHLAKGNTALSVSLTAFATALAMIMTPFNFQFYANLYPPTAAILKSVELNEFELIKIVLLILGVPLIAGMWLRSRNSNLAQRLSTILKPVSIAVFILFVLIAFMRNLDVFMQHVHHVLAYGISHNLLALGLGFALASLFKLPEQDRKTLTIETGIQNSGLGLLLVFTFFDELGGMAIIVAFWGIWHIVSGLSLASYWSAKTR